MLVCVSLGAQTTHRDSVLAQARILKQQYRFDAAAESLASLMEPGRMDTEVMGELADCHFQAGYSEDAASLYGILMQLDPDNLGYRMRYLTLSYRAKAYPETVNAGKELLQKDSLLPAVSLVGDAFAQMNMLDSALSYYSSALRRNPARESYAVKTVDVLLRQKNYPKAKEVAESFLENDPTSIPVRQLQGMAYLLTEDYKKSADIFDALTKDGDDSYATHYYLGISYREINIYLLARQELLAAWQKDSSSVALALDIAGEYLRVTSREAIGWYEKALEMLALPVNQLYNSYKGEGDSYFGREQWKNAITAYRKAQTFKPDYINTWPRVAYALERTGDKKNALDWYQRYLKAAKSDDTFWYNYATQAVKDLKAELFMEE